MINLKKLLMNKKELFLEETKKSEKLVKASGPDYYHIGRISDFDKKNIFLIDYTAVDNFPLESGGFIQRARIESERELPIPKDARLEPCTLDYALTYLKMANYYNSKKIRNEDLREKIFSGCPLPDENEKEVFKEKEPTYFGRKENYSPKKDNSKSKSSKEIGFNYSNRNS